MLSNVFMRDIKDHGLFHIFMMTTYNLSLLRTRIVIHTNAIESNSNFLYKN